MCKNKWGKCRLRPFSTLVDFFRSDPVSSTMINAVVLAIFSKRQRITLRLLNEIAIPSVCRLSVCNVGAPYSGG